uniref:Uncharacterized protein n=1 Tax=Tetradesmus obliquus TaxID=3088 RepID=A0A383WQ97_TETOB
MAQLADDLKRNLAVLATKDDEAIKLRNTVDGLRAVLAEKDSLFSQFQAQVQELELFRVQESEQRLATEQLLAAKQKEWAQQLEAGQQGKEAEVAALRQQLKDSEEKWLEQLMQARQTALDESMQRSTQQQSALEREAEHVQRLQQQLDMLGSSLAVKEAELEAAHRQLGAALDTTQKMEATHAQAISAKDALIAQLQQQLEQQASSIAASTGDHENNMTKLIKSINEMQQSCQAQSLEVQEYASAQKKLQDERKVLREQMRQMETTITKLQTEKGVLEAALQHEVTAQAGAQAQLNIFQAKLTEAVVELEKRCAAAETRSTKLMSQLVEERGRLVDAVIEQANSSTPQLAAELAKSLEADRLRTQAELQVAQERSRSLAEELSLIRSTLLPLLSAPAATAAAAAGAVPATQPANASLAALAQVMQQQQQQHASYSVAPGSPMSAATAYPGPQGFGQATCSMGDIGGGHTTYTVPFNTPAAALAAGSPGAGRYEPPNADDGNGGLGALYSGSPAASPAHRALERCCHGSNRQGERLTSQRGSGGLAGLVSELQSDVDKLQQQLHSSRRQLNWQGQQSSAVESLNAGTDGALRRPDSSGSHMPRRHASSSSNSPARNHGQHSMHSPSNRTPLRHSSSLADAAGGAAAASPGSAAAGGASEELHDALRYLLNRTEQLSLENGALRTQLLDQGPPANTVHHSHKATASGALDAGRSPQHHHLQQHSSPRSKNSKGAGGSPYARLAANSYHRIAAAAADGASDGEDDSSSVVTGSSSLADRDDLSSAASEELAAAQAAAAAECARRRRQRRAAAAAAGHGSADCYNLQHRSPSKNVLNVLQRSSSLESRETAVSDISSCSTLSPGREERSAGAAGYGRSSRAAGVNAHNSHSTGSKAGKESSSSRQLLETVLASYPNNRLGALMQELVAAAGNAGTSAAALAAAGSSGAGSGGGSKRGHGSSGRGSSASNSVNAALAREQLRRLAELSPGRQRLLRALAAADAK